MSRSLPMVFRVVVVLLAVAVLSTSPVAAQGLPTATLSGHVTSEGQPLPGVTVSLKSPALQGARTSYTTGAGDYLFVGLPPGDYTVTFAIAGFQSVTRTEKLSGAQSTTVNAAMTLSGVEATTVVVAKSEQVSETATQATTYDTEMLDKLPTARTLVAAVVLSPGVNQNGPNGAITISGAQSFDNNVLVNGVNIQDNVRGTPNNLFIEDAILETTTTTSGVSAEYGRFQGGVINTITKSGGNDFHGSFRTNFFNDAWSATTPRNETRLQEVHEASRALSEARS